MSEEIKKSEFKSINFQKASLPIFSEVLQRYPWVYYGENNLLPQYFIDLYDNCAIHKAVVTSKVNQITCVSAMYNFRHWLLGIIVSKHQTYMSGNLAMAVRITGGVLRLVWHSNQPKGHRFPCG